MLSRMRKRHIRWTIERDPTTITIKQNGKIRSGGGFKELNGQLGPFVVRIFKANSNQLQQVSELAGSKQLDSVWSMLVDSETRFETGTDIKNVFKVDELGSFEVKVLHPHIVQGEYVGALCELERVM